MYRLEMIHLEIIISNNFQINLEVYPLPDLDRYEPETWEYTMAMSMLETYTKPSVWLWNKANSIKLVLQVIYPAVQNSWIIFILLYLLESPRQRDNKDIQR